MADKFVVKDSGKRESFSTGAVRDIRAGKGRYDLVSPVAKQVQLAAGSTPYAASRAFRNRGVTVKPDRKSTRLNSSHRV